MAPTNSNETYCTFTLASDVTAGGLPSEEDIAKDLESTDDNVKKHALKGAIMAMLGGEAMPRILMQVIRFCINSQDKQLKKLCMLYWEVVPKYQEPTSEEVLQADTTGIKLQRKILPEMILVCNALMNDLNHHNEYVRGSMLRFLCKVKDEEILGPLIPSIKACLTHRHSYVRKHSALCIFHCHKLHGDLLIPDGPELVASFLQQETDVACRRNAFLMLTQQNEELALEFLATIIPQVDDIHEQYGDGFCLLVLELTRRVCRKDPQQKSRFVRILFQLLNSTSPAVSYEAAWTLCSLSTAPTAVRAAAVAYTQLLNGQTDNNIQLIVLERLDELKSRMNHTKIVQELLMDLLRALNSPNPDICRKVLEVAMDVVTARNVEQVVTTLKREVTKTMSDDSTSGNMSGGSGGIDEKTMIYRNMLVQAIHECAIRFPHVAESVVHTLMDLLLLGSAGGNADDIMSPSSSSSSSNNSALQVVIFVRAIMEQYPPLRESLLPKLREALNADAASNHVLCVILWILGEYSTTLTQMEDAFDCIIDENLQSPPFVLESKKEDEGEGDGESKKDASSGNEPRMITKNVVLADGTYATQTIYNTTIDNKNNKNSLELSIPKLRRYIIGGDIFLSEIVSSCLTKLVLKAKTNYSTENTTQWKQRTATTLLTMCGIIKMAEITISAQRSSWSDCHDRLSFLTRSLLDTKASTIITPIVLMKCKEQFASYLNSLKDTSNTTSSSTTTTTTKKDDSTDEEKKDDSDNTLIPIIHSQADDCIHFRQLRSSGASGDSNLVDLDDGADLARAATGGGSTGGGSGNDNSKNNKWSTELNHVYPLSGFADPIYAEALVTVHEYDIVLEILLLNRTPHTLSDVTVELSTMGDMKLVERPQSHTIGPLDQITIRASIKVSSTETGHIFGTIVYIDTSKQQQIQQQQQQHMHQNGGSSNSNGSIINPTDYSKCYIHLNDIHMDIMDYIRPATCSDELFRSMWAEFEWENKVAISTSIESLIEFLNHIVTSTNMKCLTTVQQATTDSSDTANNKKKTNTNNTADPGSFLAANLYARSVFGEDALVNVSVEKKDDNDGKLAGYIRIRSKTQGIALSLGDRITSVQRGLPQQSGSSSSDKPTQTGAITTTP